MGSQAGVRDQAQASTCQASTSLCPARARNSQLVFPVVIINLVGQWFPGASGRRRPAARGFHVRALISCPLTAQSLRLDCGCYRDSRLAGGLPLFRGSGAMHQVVVPACLLTRGYTLCF